MSDTKDLAADMHRLRIGDEPWMTGHGADAHLTEARQLVRAGWRKKDVPLKLRRVIEQRDIDAAVAAAMAALSKEVDSIELFSNNFYMNDDGELVPIQRVKALIAEATP